MRVDNYKRPQASFLSIEKDMSIIVDKVLKNPRIQRLLYYTTSDALDRPNLNNDQRLELLQNNIKIVSKL